MHCFNFKDVIFVKKILSKYFLIVTAFEKRGDFAHRLNFEVIALEISVHLK